MKKRSSNGWKIAAGATAIGGVAALIAAYKKSETPLKTVSNVDLKRYGGKWYEIASMPESFEKGCACTTAEYRLNPEGYVDVLNSCLKDGREKEAWGKAYPVEGSGNAKLEVEFFWPFKGKYWIMELDEDYQYALVGHPNRKHLWILSRYPEMDEDVYVEYLQKARRQGFDISKLELTEQFCQ
ncbi:lipocalin family protein [Nafulsella turpanensis]|uniref:lipocalin family protein n=1 Tax=Nafulsella turpanensis TaxID=1265690 RepID=UPI000344C457|nr:lipocalin family protein [Nafulsella turpanensis]